MTGSPTDSEMIAQCLKIRNKLEQMDDAHKNARRPYVQAKQTLENALKLRMDQSGVTQIGAKDIGTAFQKTNMYATVTDPKKFKNYILDLVADGKEYAMDLLTNAVSKETLKVYLNENNDTPPPGVDVSFETEVQIRKSN